MADAPRAAVIPTASVTSPNTTKVIRIKVCTPWPRSNSFSPRAAAAISSVVGDVFVNNSSEISTREKPPANIATNTTPIKIPIEVHPNTADTVKKVCARSAFASPVSTLGSISLAAIAAVMLAVRSKAKTMAINTTKTTVDAIIFKCAPTKFLTTSLYYLHPTTPADTTTPQFILT